MRTLVFLTLLSSLFGGIAFGQIIDDFESYGDTVDLLAVWSFGSLDTSTPNPVSGNRSLRREALDASEFTGVFSTLAFGAPVDLSDGIGVAVWVRRDSGAASPMSFDIQLSASDASGCSLPVDPEFADTDWHLVVLEFQHCALADLSSIEEISVFANNASGGVADLLVNFDDLAVVEGIFADGFESGSPIRWSSAVP